MVSVSPASQTCVRTHIKFQSLILMPCRTLSYIFATCGLTFCHFPEFVSNLSNSFKKCHLSCYLSPSFLFNSNYSKGEIIGPFLLSNMVYLSSLLTVLYYAKLVFSHCKLWSLELSCRF